MTAYDWAKLWQRYADVAAKRSASMMLVACDIDASLLLVLCMRRSGAKPRGELSGAACKMLARALHHARHAERAQHRAIVATNRHAQDVVDGMVVRR